jgi:hypothetical protein
LLLLIQLLQDFLPPVSAAEVGKAIKGLKLSKRVGAGRIPSFIIKGLSQIFSPMVVTFLTLLVM